MPVSGIPDPEQHWICIRCGQWFEADEGQLIQIERPTLIGRMADDFSGDVKMRFRCDACTRRISRHRTLLFGGLALLLLIALLFNLTRDQ
jgi:hypothetical protein